MSLKEVTHKRTEIKIPEKCRLQFQFHLKNVKYTFHQSLYKMSEI